MPNIFSFLIKLDTAFLVKNKIYFTYNVQICTVYAFISAIELPRIPAYLPKLIFYLHWIFSMLFYHNTNTFTCRPV